MRSRLKASLFSCRDDLLQCIDSLYAGRVPASWLKLSWEVAALNTWFAELLQRYEQLQRWLTTGRPKSFWLPGFFNPQGFLTAVKQEVTRRHAGDKWALDDVAMVSEVTRFQDASAVREGPGEGVFVHGLFLEGCSWSSREGKLVDPEPKKLFSQLPVSHQILNQQYAMPCTPTTSMDPIASFAPRPLAIILSIGCVLVLQVMHVTAVQLKDKKSSGFYEAPCYKVRRRTGANFVSTFMLRTDEAKSKWVLRGAALLMNVE